ncbi:hypothetical protein LZ30DRAFT_181266 [Colletotrichum cereale]|nr:hypothetical protein LZ30DRAFT_181266 [Colletotrichum cereale]
MANCTASVGACSRSPCAPKKRYGRAVNPPPPTGHPSSDPSKLWVSRWPGRSRIRGVFVQMDTDTGRINTSRLHGRFDDGMGHTTILLLSGFSPASLGRAIVVGILAASEAKRDGRTRHFTRGSSFLLSFRQRICSHHHDTRPGLGGVSSIFRSRSGWLASNV